MTLKIELRCILFPLIILEILQLDWRWSTVNTFRMHCIYVNSCSFMGRYKFFFFSIVVQVDKLESECSRAHLELQDSKDQNELLEFRILELEVSHKEFPTKPWLRRSLCECFTDFVCQKKIFAKRNSTRIIRSCHWWFFQLQWTHFPWSISEIEKEQTLSYVIE